MENLQTRKFGTSGRSGMGGERLDMLGRRLYFAFLPGGIQKALAAPILDGYRLMLAAEEE